MAANNHQLPSQNLCSAEDLGHAARIDASDVLEWYHARFPVSMDAFQKVCVDTIARDALSVQLWLRDHLDVFAPKSDQDCQQFRDSTFRLLLRNGDSTMLEWWLQAHLTTGHCVILPAADELANLYERNAIVRRWMYDVTVTRKLPLYAESESGIALYTSPLLP
ncbi:hypothetical protein BC828DRAFT_417407 [Blastocladiella britannica]|nr:hypothetical protein BC828DRAFT_417407 [Blastocladiella britannica]